MTGPARARVLALAAALLAGAPAARGQIHTENAGVLPPTLPTLREVFSWQETARTRELRATTSFTFGVTPKLELRLSHPTVLHRRVEFTGADGRRHREDLVGPADTTLAAKVSLWQRDDVLESTRWAALVEGVAPTGNDDRRDGGLRLPRRLQLSSGGWGAGAGTAFTVIRDRHRFSADAFYRWRTRHEGFQPGDSVHLDVAYWFRLHPARFDTRGRSPVEVRPVFEVLSSWRFESQGRRKGVGDDGLEVLLAPGIQVYPSKRVLLDVSVQVPVVDGQDDALGSRRWAASVGIKILF